MSKATQIAKKKDLAIEYYREVPIYRYTAMHIGISEDTLGRWRDEDADFAERLTNAKSEWVRGLLPNVKPEFALERLEREVFAPPKQELPQGQNPVVQILIAAGLTGGVKRDGKDDGHSQRPSKIEA